MLISSPRHRAEDLRLWAEHEEGDRASRVTVSLVEQSIERISAWQGDYVGCSWGKDSVVMLDLMLRAERSWPVVWVRMRGRDNPDCELVRDAFLAGRKLDYHERTFDYEACGRDEHWRAVAKEFGARRMTGLRADESGRRRMSLRHLGLDTGRSFRPLAWWSQRHVFAYLAQRDLPVHPAYACLGSGRWPRCHLRTHGIGGKTGNNYGRTEWEREYYGDVLRRLAVAR